MISRRAHLVHTQAAIFFGDVDRGKSQFGGLAQQRRHHAGLFGFDRRDARQNFFARKSLRSRRNLALLLVQIFGRKYFIGRAVSTESCRRQRQR